MVGDALLLSYEPDPLLASTVNQLSMFQRDT